MIFLTLFIFLTLTNADCYDLFDAVYFLTLINADDYDLFDAVYFFDTD